jgi:predicted cupin superfamily sugar epimerase
MMSRLRGGEVVAMESAEVRELIRVLELERGSCGYMAKTFDSGLVVTPDGAAARPAGSCLYFLVTASAGIAAHRIWSDQIYHHYAGAPLDVLLLHRDGSVTRHRVSGDLRGGERPQLLIPAGTYHLGRVADPASWALLGTTSWPAVAADEVEMTSIGELATAYPGATAALEEFATA